MCICRANSTAGVQSENTGTPGSWESWPTPGLGRHQMAGKEEAVMGTAPLGLPQPL